MTDPEFEKALPYDPRAPHGHQGPNREQRRRQEKALRRSVRPGNARIKQLGKEVHIKARAL